MIDILLTVLLTSLVKDFLAHVKKQPRLFVEHRESKRFFRLTKNYKVRYTNEIADATSFVFFSPLASYWQTLLADNEDGWKIHKRHYVKTVKKRG